MVINDLQAIVERVYDLGSCDIRIDYRQPVPPPALSEIDQQRINELLVRLQRT